MYFKCIFLWNANKPHWSVKKGGQLVWERQKETERQTETNRNKAERKREKSEEKSGDKCKEEREAERWREVRTWEKEKMCVNWDKMGLCCLIFIVMLLLVRNTRRNINIVGSIKLHQVMWFYLFSAESSSHSSHTSSATQDISGSGSVFSDISKLCHCSTGVRWWQPVGLERSTSLSSGQMIWSLLHHNQSVHNHWPHQSHRPTHSRTSTGERGHLRERERETERERERERESHLLSVEITSLPSRYENS